MKPIVWTRPAEDWESDQKLMRSKAHVLRFPLTKQIEICPQLPPRPAEVVLLTSKKAAECFVQRCKLPKDQLGRVSFYTFGLETYKVMMGLYLKAHLIEEPTAKKFAERLPEHLKKSQVIWYPRPLEVSFDLGEALRAQGFEVHDVLLYKTEPVKAIEPALVQKLTEGPCIICFASPSAVKSFVEFVLNIDGGKFNRYLPIVIGSTTKSCAQSYFKEVICASQSTLSALWEKAYETARKDDIRAYLDKP